MNFLGHRNTDEIISTLKTINAIGAVCSMVMAVRIIHNWQSCLYWVKRASAGPQLRRRNKYLLSTHIILLYMYMTLKKIPAN